MSESPAATTATAATATATTSASSVSDHTRHKAKRIPSAASSSPSDPSAKAAKQKQRCSQQEADARATLDHAAAVLDTLLPILAQGPTDEEAADEMQNVTLRGRM